MKPGQCPKCHSDNLFYNMRTYEIHRFDKSMFPCKDGWIDLESLVDSLADDTFTPYINCGDCGRDFNLDGTEKKEEK